MTRTIDVYNARDVANVLSDYVNANYITSQLAEEMLRDDLTLIQSKMRLFMAFVEKLSKATRYDERLEGSVELAKKIMKLDYYLPNI